jgi:rhodanese-related sulfurtransferase
VAISLEQAKNLFEQEILFVDARDEGYYDAGHIQGALKNAFLMELIFNIEKQQNKSDALVVYCGDPGCGDSEDLAYNLQDSGFTKLYVFKGGWLEWSKAGYPSETGI